MSVRIFELGSDVVVSDDEDVCGDEMGDGVAGVEGRVPAGVAPVTTFDCKGAVEMYR